MLAESAAWLDSMRREHLSRWVSYTRGSVTTPCLASVSKSTFEVQTDNGVVERWESRDYIISHVDLPFGQPERGDVITETMGPATASYAVCSPAGLPVWQEGDAFRKCVRIHTKLAGEE